MFRIAAVMLLSVTAVGAYGQTAPSSITLADALSGKTYALSMKLKDLDRTWRRMSAGKGGGEAGYMAALSSALTGSQSGVYYTKGVTVAIAGQSYLIAYKTASKPVNVSILRSSTPPAPTPPTPEDTISLCLLNVASAGNLTDIRPFDLKAETAAEEPSEETGAQSGTSTDNLKQIGLSLLMYTQDYDEVLPPMTDAAKVKSVLQPYCRNEKIFSNPATGKPYVPNAILSGKKLAHIANPATFAAFYEDAADRDGKRGVVYLDGHVARVSEAEWDKVKRASKIP